MRARVAGVEARVGTGNRLCRAFLLLVDRNSGRFEFQSHMGRLAFHETHPAAFLRPDSKGPRREVGR